MERIRMIVSYRGYFEDFLRQQPIKVQNKIFKILEIIEFQQYVPSKFLKHLKGTDGIYETRFNLGSDTWRVFCFFDEGQLVILLNGFVKKTQKIPKEELQLAKRLKNDYFEDKNKGKL
jgi:phage-related protein